MSVEFDTNNYNQNRQSELRTPFMAKHLMRWGWAQSLLQANIFLVIFSVGLIGASAALLLITKVVKPTETSHAETALILDAELNQ